jgi:hypothetical protein
MTTLPAAEAYSFQSNYTLEQMRLVLNSQSGLAWKGGDNDFWGEYLIARPADSDSKLRIFIDENGSFVIDLSTYPGEEGMLTYAELQGIVEQKVLPILNARNIEPHTGWE